MTKIGILGVDFTRIYSCHYQSIMFSQDLYQNEQAAYTGHFIKNLCDIRDNPNVNGLQPVEAQVFWSFCHYVCICYLCTIAPQVYTIVRNKDIYIYIYI